MEDFRGEDSRVIDFLSELNKEKFLYFRRQKILYHENVPEENESVSSTPVIFIGGYGRKYNAYKKELQNLYFAGRRVIYLNPLKGLNKKTSEYFPAQGATRYLPEIILAKAREVMALMKYLDVDKVDLVGHSQGAVVASAVSGMIDDKEKPQVNNLVLVNPAGMHGKEKVVDLIGRALFSAKLEKQKTDDLLSVDTSSFSRAEATIYKEKARRTLIDQVNFDNSSDSHRSLLWRFSSEVPDLADANILPVLAEIKSKKKIRTTLLLANKDYLFPPDRIMQHIGMKNDIDISSEERLKKLLQVVDSYAMFINKEATHNALSFETPGILQSILNEGLKKKDAEKT